MIDEPVAHLSHANAGRLVIVNQLCSLRRSRIGLTYTGEDGFLVLRRVGVGDVLCRLVSDVVAQ